MNNKLSEPLFGHTLAIVGDFAGVYKPIGVSVMETRGEPPVDDRASGPDSQPVANHTDGPNQRRRRRFEIKSNVRVLRRDRAYDGPEIAPLVDASTDGILFTTDQEYPPGAELLVKFPYPGNSSPQQVGRVVRVETLPDGRRCVAVVLR